MLRYTGHPLVDVGVATIVAMCRKQAPDEVREEDLEEVANRLLHLVYTSHDGQYYSHGPFKAALSSLFPNAVFSNNLSKDPEKATESLLEYADRILFGYRREPIKDTSQCVFCGSLAVDIVYYSQIPLVTQSVNFGPRGQAGIQICGYCLLALHAMPLGVNRVGRRYLIILSSNVHLVQRFVRRAVERNLIAMQLQTIGYPRTYIVSELIYALREAEQKDESPSVTAYVFMNSNRASYISVDILELGSIATTFLRELQHPSNSASQRAWSGIVRNSWKDVDEEADLDNTLHRNMVYEALFDLPAKARAFFYNYISPARNWSLVSLYLRKVMNMEESRLQLLYELSTRIVAYIHHKRSFYFEFGRERNYSTWRRQLLRAADDYARQHNGLLITADEFIRAFTAPPGSEFNDWKLARDIVMLRVIELRLQQGELTEDDEALLDENLLEEADES